MLSRNKSVLILLLAFFAFTMSNSSFFNLYFNSGFHSFSLGRFRRGLDPETGLCSNRRGSEIRDGDPPIGVPLPSQFEGARAHGQGRTEAVIHLGKHHPRSRAVLLRARTTQHGHRQGKGYHTLR